MPKRKPYRESDLAEVLDNPEWTKDDFKRARPFPEVFPELARRLKRYRGTQKAQTKKLVSLRLDPDVVEKFRASGPGWQTKVNRILRKAAGL